MQISLTATPKEKPTGALGFGRYFTDHMFLMDFTEERGWHDARIVPYAELTLSPATAALHYGQTSFEGLKAYKGADGSNYLFRPEMNARRINSTNARMCIPELPEEVFLDAVKTLVRTDADWIPDSADGSLYIRPFFVATDPYLGLSVSKNYLFSVILTPSGAYYEGLEQVSIWIEDEYVRAIRGGVGYVKTAGNYAASLAAMAKARGRGFAQVLWLDGVERKYIEEVGAMNIFFKISGKIVTPALSGSILPGITRDSILTLCREMGLKTEERAISVDELISAAGDGSLEEAFGTGTAAVVTPVGGFHYKERDITVGGGAVGELSRKLFDTLTAIQRGDSPDKHGWRVKV